MNSVDRNYIWEIKENKINTINLIITLLVSIALVSCGGGGGGGGSSSSSAPSVPASPDPLYVDQWHLKNTGQMGGRAGEDINVETVSLTRKGSNIRIAVVDDGMDVAHEDLSANVVAGSHNYLTNGTDPTGGEHGTNVAGIIAARDNTVGVLGVAPRASLVAYNLLQASGASNDADAMTRGSPNIHISNNSWGPPDSNGTLDAPVNSWYTAINTGLSSGRGGRGTIYTWAAGNGAPVDNSNYDGMANYRGVIAVAAVNDQGEKTSYSEEGANLLISAPGGGSCNTNTHAITTTDGTGNTGYNLTSTGAADYANRNYTRCMNGTSAATPMVAGVVALMLEANPTLGWRDVRLILAESARKNHPTDVGWSLSSSTSPFSFNHKYGFGVVNAVAAVERSSTWTNVGAELNQTTALASPAITIPDNNTTGVSNQITVTGSVISKIEFIQITFTATHVFPGELEITLTSPAGKISQLSAKRTCASNACTAYTGWVFSSARHLGESANGTWTLIVKDLAAGDIGTFQSWQLNFFGRAL